MDSRETDKVIDDLCVNTIRTLSMDAVQQANSGHPGTPMALAPVAYCLWQRFLRFDPDHPIWPNRDRFVLSVGHASMLLYSLLHLTGVKAVNPKYETLGHLSVSLEDIRKFRQLDSKCPGHPEYRWTSGVETTTGPLGQGAATSVGMAIAGRWLASRVNRPGFELCDYDVYALCGDGDMMEGLSGEAASLAGHLKLPNLCWIYDNNHITIEGSTELAFSDDTATRFVGYGWKVTRVGDADDLDMLTAMAAVLNGLSLSKLRPFGSGFLIFSDYARPAIRLSALMEIPVIHIFTHDSIGVGEDGPTHQPVEQLASLRAIPGLITIRPADANEVVEAWRVIMPLRHEPVALILTRQALPVIDRQVYASADGVRRGAYILADADTEKPDVLLLATGSEVPLCIQAYERLKADKIKARVVSMPSWEIFESYCQEHPEYREHVLPQSVTARVSVEKASKLGWSGYVGSHGHSIGMETFGASAPLEELTKKFGFTVENIVAAAKDQITLSTRKE